MHLFQLARHPTRAIRIALLGMLLAFGLNAIAHAGHSHDSNAGNSSNFHAASCGYCATFSAAIDTPQLQQFKALPQVFFFLVVATTCIAVVRRTPTSANPRAPPALNFR